MKTYIKNKLYTILRSWMKGIENENTVSLQSQCDIDPSVKQTGTAINGIVKVGPGSVLEKSKLSGKLSLGKNVKIAHSVTSGNISIGDYSKIIDGAELHGTIEIGKNTTINGPNTDLRAAIHKIRIGNFCSIARNVTFQEYYHDHNRLTTYMVKKHLEGKPYEEDIISKGAIEIGHDVWIGTHCVVLSGAKVGTGAVIAANSVVIGDIPPYAIVAGSPAKIIKYRFDEAVITELLKSEWWLKPHSEVVAFFNSFSGK